MRYFSVPILQHFFFSITRIYYFFLIPHRMRILHTHIFKLSISKQDQYFEGGISRLVTSNFPSRHTVYGELYDWSIHQHERTTNDNQFTYTIPLKQNGNYSLIFLFSDVGSAVFVGGFNFSKYCFFTVACPCASLAPPRLSACSPGFSTRELCKYPENGDPCVSAQTASH